MFDSYLHLHKNMKIKRKNYLNCHSCGSLNVDKTLMAPKLLSKSGKKVFILKNIKIKKFMKKLENTKIY